MLSGRSVWGRSVDLGTVQRPSECLASKCTALGLVWSPSPAPSSVHLPFPPPSPPIPPLVPSCPSWVLTSGGKHLPSIQEAGFSNRGFCQSASGNVGFPLIFRDTVPFYHPGQEARLRSCSRDHCPHAGGLPSLSLGDLALLTLKHPLST